MTEIRIKQENRPDLQINLRDPLVAAFLAWLWPGAGHLYQRRTAKGLLFMICIVTTFVFGMGLGRGRVVYASTRKHDFRWQYFFQLGAGGLSVPAIFQAYKTKDNGAPLFPLAHRYPEGGKDLQGNLRSFQIIDDPDELKRIGDQALIDGLYAPPPGPIYEQENDVLGMWHYEMNQRYDVGTLFTMIAGLLNILVVYDAFAGPFVLPPEEIEKRRKKSNREKAAPASPQQ